MTHAGRPAAGANHLPLQGRHRHYTFLISLCFVLLEVYLHFYGGGAARAPRTRSAMTPSMRQQAPEAAPSPPPRGIPDEGTLWSPCTQNSDYINTLIKNLWDRSQGGDDIASQCCLCMDCSGGDNANNPTCNSQFGQDLFLFRNFFRCLPGPGAYVDVGTHHPKTLSNTYFFDVCLGWKEGVCVEASAYYADLIRGSRNCKVMQTAVGTKEGFLQLKNAGARSEVVRSEAPESGGDTQWVRSSTLSTIFREANLTIGDGVTGECVIIDFLSIDVEGNELEALLGLPWDSIWARIIMVENVKASQDVFEFLVDKGE